MTHSQSRMLDCDAIHTSVWNAGRWQAIQLTVRDVILGVNGEPFSHDPREELGKAIMKAETEAGGGKLKLNVWREGETGTVNKIKNSSDAPELRSLEEIMK